MKVCNYCFLWLTLFLLPGCSLYNLQHDIVEAQSHIILKGKAVTKGSPIEKPMIVVLVKNGPVHPVVVQKIQINRDETYRFSAPCGRYRIFIYEDSNGDQVFQDSERIGQSMEISGVQPGREYSTDVIMPDVAGDALLAEIDNLKKNSETATYFRETTSGSVLDLDSSEFAMKNAELGLWQPLEFMKTVPFGLFFLSQYDPDKVPVLFIHGVSGSPAQFSDIIDSLDTSLFQAWVFFYPSGVPIKKVGNYLSRIMEQARLKHGFDRLNIVAHSLGGLVGRSYLNEYRGDTQGLTIDKFITLSSPWGGHSAALMGQKYSPAIIPMWHDIAPGSAFLQSLFLQPLPQDTSHYLMFGFQGSSAFAGGNSDGVISMASQLRIEAQEGATRLRGFDEDHTSILKSSLTLRYIKTILTH